MEDIRKVGEALIFIERYSDYLCRKAWGKSLIIWGIMAPIGLLLYFNRQSLSNLLNMGIETFSILTTAIIALIGIGMTLYIFTSASRLLETKKEKTESSSPKEMSLLRNWFQSRKGRQELSEAIRNCETGFELLGNLFLR